MKTPIKAPILWRITCMEDEYPGLWLKWFNQQCVTDGHSPEKGFKLVGGKTNGERDWVATRNALKKIQVGHLIVVALPNCRVGRIGEVVDKKIEDDDWDALIPENSEDPDGWKNGYMGRRIFVRWELDQGAPESADVVVQLPDGVNLGRGTLRCVHTDNRDVEWFRKVIRKQETQVGMANIFGYERSLSDYIAQFPHRLKNGLQPYPNQKEIREKVFRDRSRSDVLLLDGKGKPVIVECKQGSPTVDDVQQLRHYIKKMKSETGKHASGILVHGGARTVDKKVRQEADDSKLEIFQYKLDVDFSPSC